MNAYLDMGNNKIINPDTLNGHKADDDYDTILNDLKSCVNTEFLDSKLKKKKRYTGVDGNYFDFRQNVITNTEPYYDGLFRTNDLVSKAFVDAAIARLPKPKLIAIKLHVDG